MPLSIIRNDITRVKADAIINTANPDVAVGEGTDYAVYKAAGLDKLLAERAGIGSMKPGQAAVTPAFALDAKYIIHTVGPAWRGGSYGERETVAECYRNCLEKAAYLECESAAFPLISTGTYGFPKDEALDIAIREISRFLDDHEMDVTLVVYDKESFALSSELFEDVRSYISDAEAAESRIPDVFGDSYMSVPMESGSSPKRSKRRLFGSISGKRRRDPEESAVSPLPLYRQHCCPDRLLRLRLPSHLRLWKASFFLPAFLHRYPTSDIFQARTCPRTWQEKIHRPLKLSVWKAVPRQAPDMP